ncbi:MAG: hypothetical protein ACOVJ4_03030 [Sphingobacteriaceae bacterium]
MKRLLSLILIVCLSFVVNKGFAQFQSKPLGSSNPTTKPAPKPATTTTTVAAGPATATAGKSVQKLPSPYLLKKDFEDRIAGVEGAANSAKKATNSLRAEIEGKFQSVEELNNKMTSVEEILNSANFKIATTNDSLKLTQTSIDEFRVETEAKLKTLEKADEQFTYAYAGIGLALVLVIVVFVVMNSKINTMKAIIAAQEEVISKKIHDEMHHVQTKLSRDISHAKSDMNHKLDAEKTAVAEQIQSILDQINKA